MLRELIPNESIEYLKNHHYLSIEDEKFLYLAKKISKLSLNYFFKSLVGRSVKIYFSEEDDEPWHPEANGAYYTEIFVEILKEIPTEKRIPIKAVKFTPTLTGKHHRGERYCIIAAETGEILDDANGYGYKSQRNAHIAYTYKLRH